MCSKEEHCSSNGQESSKQVRYRNLARGSRMMAMSFKRDLEGTPAATTAAKTEEATPESKEVFRGNGNGESQSDSERKTPLHSGLSALIQAATSQLGQVDDTASSQQRPSSRRSSYTETLQPSSGSTAPRYTPHGFHTTPTTTTTPSDGCVPSTGFSSSLNNTPILGPETASEVRRRTFPEVLMTVLEDKTNADVVTFLPDGKYFAVRRKEFSETTMMNYFAVDSFEDFLKKIHSWGFSRIERGVTPSGCHYDNASSNCIEIFRHPMFVKGDWEKCSRICFGDSPTEVRLSALPDRARIEYTLSDESTLTASKRRLSPSHARKDSESSITTSKQKLACSDENLLLQFSRGETRDLPAVSKSESAETTTSADASTIPDRGIVSQTSAEEASTKREDDVRSLALAITTEKLNLKTDAEEQVDISTPLVERAVENATHTIVTDAIETLLRDEGHTRETYLKHEQELSQSSLPGIVPISKQLFAPPADEGEVPGNGSSLNGEQKPQQPNDSIQDSPNGDTVSFEGIRTRSAARKSSKDSVLTSINNNVGVVISTSSNT